MSEQHEAVFVDLVQRSWKFHQEFEHVRHVDDVLLGAVIAGTVRLGLVLIDLESDGDNHFLRFEDLRNKERMTFRLRHMTPDPTSARTLGNLANVTVGTGKPVTDIGRLWGTLKQEVKSAFILSDEPGLVTLDADVTAGYIYAQVPLIWNLGDYLDGWVPDYEKVASHIYCCQVALEKYLDARLKLA